jgi:hypothetical protein
MGRFRSLNTTALLTALGLTLTGCGNGEVTGGAAQTAADAPGASPITATETSADAIYQVDLDSSEVYWRIYRAGAAARFGHNHVISVSELEGRVYRDADLSESRFELVLPVAAFVVDDPAIRSRYGEDFASEPSAEDIAGTRTNMLSENLLDGSGFPAVRVRGTGPIEQGGNTVLALEIDIVGRTVPVTVPTTVDIDEQRLEARGEFRLTHEQLGLMPFSIMMGALRVAEEMDFTYRIVARRVN